MFDRFRNRVRDMWVPAEPPLPENILNDMTASCLNCLPFNATVCIKVSAAYPAPYPFAVSCGFTAAVVAEMLVVRPDLKIEITEGGVGNVNVTKNATELGLDRIDGARFVDAESTEQIYVENPSEAPYAREGFWLPSHWVNADLRVLLTTCKLRSHHFKRWYSGGTRNLIGLLPREHYQLATSKRAMRSEAHQTGMDAIVADLYATTGRGALTILDGRMIARHDEHLPIRFTRKLNEVIVANDAAEADLQMCRLLRLPFVPPYLARIEAGRQQDSDNGTPPLASYASHLNPASTPPLAPPTRGGEFVS